MHAQTLWACDFFSKHVWTKAGLVEVFVLFFIHVGTRRVQLAGMSASPNSAWIAEQARAVAPAFGADTDAPITLLHDFDCKFTKEFGDILQAKNITVKKVGPRKPNQNAFAERWVQSVQQECLDRFVVFGEDHLRHIVSQYVEHYNEERPHQARDNLPLTVRPADVGQIPSPPRAITCHSRLGGLLNHYVAQLERRTAVASLQSTVRAGHEMSDSARRPAKGCGTSTSFNDRSQPSSCYRFEARQGFCTRRTMSNRSWWSARRLSSDGLESLVGCVLPARGPSARLTRLREAGVRMLQSAAMLGQRKNTTHHTPDNPTPSHDDPAVRQSRCAVAQRKTLPAKCLGVRLIKG